MKYLMTLLLGTTSLVASAQQKSFAVEDLMKNKLPKNFTQPLPVFVKWIGDEQFIYNKSIHPDSSLKPMLYDIKSGKEMPATPQQLGSTSKSIDVRLVVKNNDVYLIKGAVEERLTNDDAEEKNPTFSPDSSFVAYTKNNNLYTLQIATKKENQLTTDGSDVILNGYASWVYWEEIFGRPTRFRAFWWSPDSKTLAYMRFDQSMIKMFPLYNSDGTHGFIEETRYPKAGDPNPEVKIGFVNPNGGKTIWADFNEKDDQYFGWPIWPNQGNEMWVQWINRDQNHLKIYAVNVSNGSKKIVYEEQQKTWVDLEDGAGGRIEFLKNGKQFILQSDKTGWNHLYLHNIDGKEVNPITSGNYTVLSIEKIDEQKQLVYFTARSKENSARRDLYSVQLDGKNLQRLTFGEYNHVQTKISPSGKYIITTYSNVSTPPQMALVDAKGKVIAQLGSMKTALMDEYKMAKTELLRIKSEDGLFDLPLVVTWPTNFDPNKKYPMLVSIYGGPNAGTVWDNWSWNAMRQYWAEEGLIQVAFDHRASGHFGKAGVNYIHRNLGDWELKDYSHMAKWFIEKGYADPTKIAITGFSYGGYMTCLALTKGSDVFTHGMAGGSVVDWQLYDSHYTEKFMDRPQDNKEGYKVSSVLNYVDRYKGVLQIVHGTMDDNVHMQNSIQLISLLQDKKKDFELMLYPGGRHGWGGAKGEHFTNLKNQFIYQHLLEKPMPKGLRR